MVRLNYPIPYNLAKLIAHRLAPQHGSDIEADSNPFAQLTNAEISRILREMLESPEGESLFLKENCTGLTEEEQKQKNLLLTRIRMEATKLILRQPSMDGSRSVKI